MCVVILFKIAFVRWSIRSSDRNKILTENEPFYTKFRNALRCILKHFHKTKFHKFSSGLIPFETLKNPRGLNLVYQSLFLTIRNILKRNLSIQGIITKQWVPIVLIISFCDCDIGFLEIYESNQRTIEILWFDVRNNDFENTLMIILNVWWSKFFWCLNIN